MHCSLLQGVELQSRVQYRPFCEVDLQALQPSVTSSACMLEADRPSWTDDWYVCRKLSGRGLNGTIPPDADIWGHFTSLQVLDLSDNQLNGRIPTGVARSRQLRVVYVSALV
jgi:hypothetical protein